MYKRQPENIGKKWYELTSTHILDGIGSTEMLHIFLSNKIDDLEYGTTGIAVPGYELKLLDENNNIIDVKKLKAHKFTFDNVGRGILNNVN